MTKKKSKGTDKRRSQWTIKQAVIKDINLVFKNGAAIHSVLDTNNKTWAAITSRSGVKKETARDIAKNFVKFLRKFSDGSVDGDKSLFDSDEAKDAYKASYKKVGEDKTYEELIEKID